MRRLASAGLCLSLFIILLSSCDSTGVGGPQGPATGLAISPADAVLEGPGDTLRLQATVTNADGDALSATVTWSTLDTDIATVADGLVTAQALGTTGVVAQAEGLADTATISVTLGSLACSSLSLDRTSAVPLDTLTFTGVPGDLGDILSADVRPAGNDTLVIPNYVWRDSADATVAHMFAPIHPAGGIAGGDVEIVVNDFQQACPDLDFTVEAIPAHPGSLEEIADATADLVDATARFYGTTAAELETADPDTVPVQLLPLMYAQLGLNHPDNPNTLMALLGGTAPALDGAGAPDLELPDALLGYYGVPDSIRAAADAATVLADSANAIRAANPAAGGVGPDAVPAGAAAVPTAANAFASPGAAMLDIMMRTAWRAGIAMADDPGTIRDPKGYWTLFTATLGAGSLIPGYGEGFAAVGLGAFVYQTAVDASANLLPSHFTNMDVDLNPAVMEEDRESGAWSNARVYAESNTWNAGKAALEAMFQVITSGAAKAGGFRAWFDEAAEAAEAAGKSLTAAQQAINNNFSDFFLNKILETVLTAAGDAAGQGEIGPLTYGPTDISEKEYSDSRILDAGNAAVTLVSHWDYEPVKLGTATLEVTSEPNRFGFNFIKIEKGIEVAQMEVTVTPSETTVTPGDPVEFTAEVSNAVDPSVEWQASSGSFTGMSSLSDGRSQATLETPTNEDDYPVTVRAVSTSSTGLRKDAATPREDEAVVYRKHLEVSPDPGCVKYGDTVTFTATMPGVDASVDVTWSVDGAGSIDASGVYTAPSGDGTATITAALKDDPTVKGSVSVTVREQCDCWWTASVNGTYGGIASGDYATFVASPAFTGNFFDTGGSLDMAQFAITMQTPPAAGDLGTFPISGSVTVGDGRNGLPATFVSGDSSAIKDKNGNVVGHLPPQPTVTFSEYTSDHIRGFISGRYVIQDDPTDDDETDILEAIVDIEFRARNSDTSDTICQ